MYLGSNEQIFATGSDLHHRELLYRQLAKRGGRGFLWLLHAQQCRHDGIRSLIPSLFQTHTPSLFRRSVPLVQEAVQLVAACWHPSARGWSRRFPKMGCRLLPLKRLVLATRPYNLFFHAEQSCFPRGTEQQLLRLQSDLPHQAVCSLVLRYSCPLHPQSNSQSGR